MRQLQLFGTDGIRGQAGVFPMTVELALSFGRALGEWIKNDASEPWARSNRPRVIIGKDTRASGDYLEHAIASGLCATGVDVDLVSVVPTAAIAYLVSFQNASAGVMVTASHNPSCDNGFKVFDRLGHKIEPIVQSKIEALIQDERLGSKNGINEVGRCRSQPKLQEKYLVHLESLIAPFTKDQAIRVVTDCANGAACHFAPLLLTKLGLEVVLMGTEANGVNINENVGSEYPIAARETLIRNGAQAAILFDGDADRLVMLDENGVTVSGDALLAMLAIWLKKKNALCENAMVATTMSSVALDRALCRHGIKLFRSDVGDRNVATMMRENKISFGGEQSGHIIFSKHNPSGDGILAALMVLDMMRETGKTLSELKKVFIPVPQTLLSFEVPCKPSLDSMLGLSQKISTIERELEGSGRVLVRYSGTESKARVLVEAQTQAASDALADSIKATFLSELAEMALSNRHVFEEKGSQPEVS